jgi:hypothetical protein
MAWPGKSQIYAYTVLAQFNQLTGSQNAGSDSYKIALYGTGTPVNTASSLAATEYGTTWNTCTEVSNSGTYAAGGSVLTSPTSAQSTNTWVFACTTANSWTGATISSYGALIYDHTTDSGANPGLAYLDFLGDQSVTGGTFTVTYAPNIAVITLT